MRRDEGVFWKGMWLLLAASMWSCQDRGGNPELWTLQEVHLEVSLEGGHRKVACNSCHVEGVYARISADCWSCHEADYEGAPDHVAIGYPRKCLACHTLMAWRPAVFDHSATGFPLEGAHASVACASCHVGGVYGGTPIDCWSCHEGDSRGVEDPDHANFSTDCAVCHTTMGWRPATFDHSATGFPLEGAHASVACASCHVDGVFASTPSDCWSCHRLDEPVNHFGPDCGSCHTSVAWEPSTFNHELLFPLLRGEHRRYRNDCASCHPDLSRYAVFTCTDCHDGEHSRARTDREHDEVRDYRYESTACLQCHPSGGEAEGDD